MSACTFIFHTRMLFTKLIKLTFFFFLSCCLEKKKPLQGSNLLNDVAVGIHFVPTGVDEGVELGNKAGMCSGC